MRARKSKEEENYTLRSNVPKVQDSSQFKDVRIFKRKTVNSKPEDLDFISPGRRPQIHYVRKATIKPRMPRFSIPVKKPERKSLAKQAMSLQTSLNHIETIQRDAKKTEVSIIKTSSKFRPSINNRLPDYEGKENDGILQSLVELPEIQISKSSSKFVSQKIQSEFVYKKVKKNLNKPIFMPEHPKRERQSTRHLIVSHKANISVSFQNAKHV